MASVVPIFSGVTTTKTSDVFTVPQFNKTFQATVHGTGAVTATVVVEVSNDALYWVNLATITLSGTTSATDGFASSAEWLYMRERITAITGTGATIDSNMGV